MEGKKIKKLIVDRVFLNLLFFFTALFLIFNIVSSQMISPFYFQFIGDDKKSAIIFLQKIKSLVIFPSELAKYQKIYGNQITEAVFKPDQEKNTKIKNLEQILTRNQSSRDVLYGLYILNMEKGDNIKADEYLKQATIIDPVLIK